MASEEQEREATLGREDARLVRAALAGSTRAFDALVERNFGAVYLTAYARLANHEAAEDLAQEVFLTAYLNLHRLQSPGSFPIWLRQLTRNRAIDWLRRNQRMSRLLPLVAIGGVGNEVVDMRTRGAREIAEAKERHQAVRDAIEELSPDQREIVLLHYVEGLSKSEIARRVGLHPSSVGRQIGKALATMKSALEPVLRELAPAMRAPRSATTRTTALIAAASALSAAKQEALANATLGAGKLAAGSLGPSANTTGIGALFASLKAVFAGTGKGAAAVSIKAKAVAAVLAVSLAAGSVLLPSQNGEKAVGAAQTAKPLEFPLEMKTLSLAEDDFPDLGRQESQLKRAKPTEIEIENEPAMLSNSPLYGTLEFGKGKRVVFRLDEATGPEGGFDRLIIDQNGNRDLTDDPIVLALEDLSSRRFPIPRPKFSHLRRGVGRETVYFGPIEMESGQPKGTWRPRLRAIARIFRPLGGSVQFAGGGSCSGFLNVNHLACLETTVELDGVKERILITDGDFDMSLRVGKPGGGDRIFRNGDNIPWWWERLPLDQANKGQVFHALNYFGTNLYTVTLAEDLSTLRLEPYKGPATEVTFQKNIKALTFRREGSDGKWDDRVTLPDGGKAKMQPGRYWFASFYVEGEDDDGSVITASCYHGPGVLNLEANKTTSIIVGLPLVAEVIVRKKAAGQQVGGEGGPPVRRANGAKFGRPWEGTRPGDAPDVPYLEIEVKVTGAAGEDYHWFQRFSKEKGGATRIRPEFRILDEKGSEILHDLTGDEHGNPMLYAWHIPKNLLGKKIRIVPVLDLGPLKTICKPLDLRL